MTDQSQAAPKTGDDLLWRNLKELPAFRGLLRAVEARFYQQMSLPEPILDLGSGDAHFASVAFDKPLTAGVDPWTPPLREARRLRPNAYRLLVQAEGGALPFPDGYFASAVSNSVLEHIPVLEPVVMAFSLLQLWYLSSLLLLQRPKLLPVQVK